MKLTTPDLSHVDDLTWPERNAADKYTRISRCVVAGEPDTYNAWLVVGPQQFCVSPVAFGTAKEAAYMCWLLAKALLEIKLGCSARQAKAGGET